MASKTMMYSFDLSGCQWVICAYYSRDANMIQVAESDISPHVATGSLITGVDPDLIMKENKIVGVETNPEVIYALREKYIPELLKGDRWIPRLMSIRQCGKKSNHGLNYDETAERFALEYEIEYEESRRIYTGYHAVYPGIQKGMHEYIQSKLRKDRTLTNCFGESREFRDAWGRDLFKDAYAYIPQSTEAHITDTTMINVYNDDADFMQPLELLQEVYDSLRYQYPIGSWGKAARMVKRVIEHMSIECSYWGRDFTIGVDLKVGLNASDMVELDLPSSIKGIGNVLRDTWKGLASAEAKKAAA